MPSRRRVPHPWAATTAFLAPLHIMSLCTISTSSTGFAYSVAGGVSPDAMGGCCGQVNVSLGDERPFTIPPQHESRVQTYDFPSADLAKALAPRPTPRVVRAPTMIAPRIAPFIPFPSKQREAVHYEARLDRPLRDRASPSFRDMVPPRRKLPSK